MQLLDIRNLTIELRTSDTVIRAVDRVSMTLKEGEVHALVGESGSGKSLIAKAIVGVLNKRWHITADRMHWRGVDLMRLSNEQRRKLVGQDIAMIYQDPSRCLDPTAKIFDQIAETLPAQETSGFFLKRNRQRKDRVKALIHKVGIKDHKKVLDSYPHELSEGICQKVMIAMADHDVPRLLLTHAIPKAHLTQAQFQQWLTQIMVEMDAVYKHLQEMEVLLIDDPDLLAELDDQLH